MPDEITPREDQAPEQESQGAPGSGVTIPEAVYKIYTYLGDNKLVDMSLQAEGNNVHNVKVYRDTSASESTWLFISKPAKGGYLIANGRNYSLALGESTNNSVITSAITERPAQIWVLKSAGNEFYYFENKYDGKVMDLHGASTADNTNIINNRYSGWNNQKFRLVRIRDLPEGPKSK
ncbi:RICIN domain-containing protein [Pseudomonas sp. Z1-12]|uniref:RICIN domain-containing protein n=1 Tax=Pseudomonas sp. Z1-12 TaxID=2817408 RepID=UPI003DA987B5